MPDLKPCPFCGGKAELKRISSNYLTSPRTTIMDKWTVRCEENHCCDIGSFTSQIYQAEDGKIVVLRDGAKDACELWNRRAGEEDKHEAD